MIEEKKNHRQPFTPCADSEDNPFFDERNVSVGAKILSKEDIPPGKEIPANNSFTDAITIEDVEDRKADRALRDKFGEKAYRVAKKSLYGWAWLIAIYCTFKFRFQVELLSDNVLIAITSAVTLNVFAAFLGVIRGLFPSNRKDKE